MASEPFVYCAQCTTATACTHAGKCEKGTPDINRVQVGGDHYRKYGNIQPWDLWWLFNLNPFQATIIKRIIRYRDKDGIVDLEKARHELDKLIGLIKEGKIK